MIITCATCGTEFEDKTKKRKYCKYLCAFPETPSSALWGKVNKLDPEICWEWSGCKDKDGYGRYHHRKTIDKAHRVVWKFTNGEIPKDKIVCHRCDNPSCCNPNHLFLGTVKENIWDCCRKGRRVQRRPRSILDPEIVHSIRRNYDLRLVTQIKMSFIYGVSISAISNVCSRKSWAYLPERVE